ncbi:phosphatidate cytidylyltransferase [Dellaglioa carnosa]|uniref:Phosphatidate cytidylyltransferase n=1 Tax=Dellaglioa carnosa TaxID=2995136 RepID=A0ABT4JLJ5_9LACO|nr:phosphatidate cytidylyltransferase [Dellaglioa carnosa]MCZ2490851.1 phosphatidate cytidylyltransferase [Dellaglioa carnosa]MCZ2493929.1 phosphatidate cytidylyltransferase [Dellaglioa carnosa]MDK1730793.1 phosphatidate cytidylyltransferase [Dellaglioa carnosa]
MRQRVITAIVALCVFIPLVIIGGLPLQIFALILGCIGISEVFVMKKKLLISPEATLGLLMTLTVIAPNKWFAFLPGNISSVNVFYFLAALLLMYMVTSKNRFSFDDAGVFVLSSLYVGMGFHYFIAARGDNFDGLMTLAYILIVIWTTDTGAYSFGRKFGKHKLAPHISPNKTWEGSIGGTLMATLLGSIFVYFFPQNHSFPVMILITLILSVFGQCGDLVESAFKRFYGVKDSGRILPGHGGILDRFDSLIFVWPIMHLFGLM